MVDPQTRVVRLTLVRIARIAVIASMALALGAMAAHAQPRSASSAAPAAALRTHAHAHTRAHHHHRARVLARDEHTPRDTRPRSRPSPRVTGAAESRAAARDQRSRTGGTRGGARYALAPTPTSVLMPTSVQRLEPRWNESATNYWSIVLAGRGPPRASPSSHSADSASPARIVARTTAPAASWVASTCRPAPLPNRRRRSATAFAPAHARRGALAFTPLPLQRPGSIPGTSAIRSPEGEPERLCSAALIGGNTMRRTSLHPRRRCGRDRDRRNGLAQTNPSGSETRPRLRRRRPARRRARAAKSTKTTTSTKSTKSTSTSSSSTKSSSHAPPPARWT